MYICTWWGSSTIFARRGSSSIIAQGDHLVYLDEGSFSSVHLHTESHLVYLHKEGHLVYLHEGI